MTRIRSVAFLPLLLITLFSGARSAAAAPAAPNLIGPATGASVTEPFTLSWSAVAGTVAAYNWEVSTTSSFSAVVANGSTTTATQGTVSGLPNGTYYWHADVYDGSVTGPWSVARTFTITGANANAPAPPTLNPIPFGAAFHPMETFPFSWSAVPGAATYTVDASMDPNFPLLSEVHVDNIPNTSYSLTMGESMPQGTYYLRVSAVSASGVYSQPSNLRTFVLSYNAPLPPPPTLIAPANGATVPLPVTLRWSNVPNPQNAGYTFEIATDPQFKNLEDDYNQDSDPFVTEPSLTPGTKYWRIRATQGDASPTTAAVTAWSTTGSFVVGSNPTAATPSVTIASPFSGDTETVSVQLTAPAPLSGATVALSSSNPTAAPVPATFSMPAGRAYGTFQLQLGQVTTPTPVTITESINGTSASVSQTVQPPSLKAVSVFSPVTGGSTTSGIIHLNGEAPAGGAVVSLSSSDPTLVTLPSSITVAAGIPTATLNIPTNAVTANTPVTITASWQGVSRSTTLTLSATPAQAPAALTLNPTSTSGTNGSTGTVTLASPVASDTAISLASGIPSLASVPASVLIPQGATSATFAIATTAVAATTTVTIQATAGGVTKSADLTLVGASGPALASLWFDSTSVQGGSTATGTVTLNTMAPAGGLLVTLASSNSALASVPSGVTVPAGSTSASFPVTTTAPNASTSVTISGTGGGATHTATLTVTPVTPAPTDTVAVTLAEYDVSKSILHVQATGSVSGATLNAYVSSTGALIGNLTSTGGGKFESQFSWPSNPGNITVRSSLGGSASRAVTPK